MRSLALFAFVIMASPVLAQEVLGWETVPQLDSASLAAEGWRIVSATTFTTSGAASEHKVLVTFWEGEPYGRLLTFRCEESLGGFGNAAGPQQEVNVCMRPRRNRDVSRQIEELLEGPAVVVEDSAVVEE